MSTPSEIRYKVMAGTDEIEIIKQICGRCKLPIDAENRHNACRREDESELASERERQRRNQSIQQFGSVLPLNEYNARLYPDMIVEGFTETYNKRLKREAEEKEAAHYTKLAARRDRREFQLPAAIRNLKSLETAVLRDAEEERLEQEQAATK